jgi:hypothetical protein
MNPKAMAVTSTNLIHDVISFVKQSLSTIADPIANSRQADSKFILTSYPQRQTVYPLITIKLINQKANRAGMQTVAMDVELTLEIRVWARNQKEKDDLSNQVYKTLRDLQFTSSTGSVASNLNGYTLLSDVEVDEPGEGNPKSRIIQIKYSFYNI